MNVGIAIGLGLAAASTTLTNLAYSREHDAAAALPTLSMRRPLHSLHLLLSDRSWMVGFGMESGGFALYAAALALAPLALVQSIGAGGIGVLAYVSARVSGRRLDARGLTGVRLSCQILCDHDMTVRAISRLAGSGRKDAGARPAEVIP